MFPFVPWRMQWAISPVTSLRQKCWEEVSLTSPELWQLIHLWSIFHRTGDIIIFHSHLIIFSSKKKKTTKNFLTNIYKTFSVKVSMLHFIKAEVKNSTHLEGFFHQGTTIYSFSRKQPLPSNLPDGLLGKI